jgi:hypothetical protein
MLIIDKSMGYVSPRDRVGGQPTSFSLRAISATLVAIMITLFLNRSRRFIMTVSICRLAPVDHLPLVLGVLRKLEVAQLIDTMIPPNPAHVLSSGRGVEALVLAILDGHHALYKVGRRLDERGMLPLLQPGLEVTSVHDARLGQILDVLFATNLNQVFSAVALKALETYAISTPWMHQNTTTISLYGAYADVGAASDAPRPAYGLNKDGWSDLKQVLLSLGVSGDGGLPLRMGLRDGNTSDSVEVPQAIEESLALGLEGFKGMVADSKAYSQRTLGLCLEQQIGLVTLVPRTCGIRQEVEAWGQKQSSLPLLVDKPARRRRDAPRDGMVAVLPVRSKWNMTTVTSSGLRFALWRCIRISWLSTMKKPMARARCEKSRP